MKTTRMFWASADAALFKSMNMALFGMHCCGLLLRPDSITVSGHVGSHVYSVTVETGAFHKSRHRIELRQPPNGAAITFVDGKQAWGVTDSPQFLESEITRITVVIDHKTIHVRRSDFSDCFIRFCTIR